MLGATQSVDMTSSLRNDYGRVEVAVLNVDLLPNSIDSVVIGDRLFTLPIQVEGRNDDIAHDFHMEVDHGNNDDSQGEKKNDNEPNDDRPGYVKEKMQKEVGTSQYNSSSNGKQVKKPIAAQNEGIGSAPSILPTLEFYTGNSELNFSQGNCDVNNSTEPTNDSYIMSSSPVDPGNVTTVTPPKKGKGDSGKKTLKQLEKLSPMPTKRSKRRENSVDEDSSARAERLKAKRNLDVPGMSSTKSFLCFSDSQIASNIANLGVLLGNNVNKSIENIKLLEHDRLVAAATNEHKNVNTNKTEEEEDDILSEKDSDLGLWTTTQFNISWEISRRISLVRMGVTGVTLNQPQGNTNLVQTKRLKGRLN
jgi:hypothetical protein